MHRLTTLNQTKPKASNRASEAQKERKVSQRVVQQMWLEATFNTHETVVAIRGMAGLPNGKQRAFNFKFMMEIVALIARIHAAWAIERPKEMVRIVRGENVTEMKNDAQGKKLERMLLVKWLPNGNSWLSGVEVFETALGDYELIDKEQATAWKEYGMLKDKKDGSGVEQVLKGATAWGDEMKLQLAELRGRKKIVVTA